MLLTILLSLVAVTANNPGDLTQACAHRGDQACAPENTLAAFRLAVEKKAPMIEFDVQATKDGQLVIMHDSTVDRTTDGKGKVVELSFDEIRALDAGSWFNESFKGEQVPTLEETLEIIPESILCNVHLKNSPGVALNTARVIKRMGKLKHCFLACTIKQAEEAHAEVPEIKICNMDRQGANRESYAEQTIELKADYIQIHLGQGLTGLKEDVDRLHAAGVWVNFFGAQKEPLIQSLAEAGVDYILTDDLDLCQRVLEEYAK
ncbi:MAG: glycerophosphodiester phosphodiesterase [Candidatus Hydrogenedentes bacterium]|nr:glycerophosphodiester phosphodiesterase [Candidatus Hydrogenedentota bacterium]